MGDYSDLRQRLWGQAVLEDNYTAREAAYAIERLQQERDVAIAALEDLASGAPRVQCLVARLGEGTLECRPEQICASCRAARRIYRLERFRELATSHIRKLRARLAGKGGE